MHFMRLANTPLKDGESARNNHAVSCNFAKYSAILICFTHRLSNKPFLIWLLTTPPQNQHCANCIGTLSFRSVSKRLDKRSCVLARRPISICTVKGKGSPYSIAERKVPELIPVLGSQPAGDVSHKPGSRLPLLSARPAVTLATLKRAATSFAAWWTEAQWVWTACLRLLLDSDGNMHKSNYRIL